MLEDHGFVKYSMIYYLQFFTTGLAMCRHIHTSLRCNRILTPPQTRHSFLLRIEAQSRFAIERVRASTRNTLLVSREAEHRQWDRDGHIDAHLAGLDVLLEVRGGGAAAREDGDAVAVFVGVDEIYGFIDGVDVQADEDGAEDFFGVASHVGFDVRNDRGTDLRVQVRLGAR